VPGEGYTPVNNTQTISYNLLGPFRRLLDQRGVLRRGLDGRLGLLHGRVDYPSAWLVGGQQ